MWSIFAFAFAFLIATTNCALNKPLCPKGGSPVCAKADYEFIYFENECKLNVYSYKRMFAGKPRPIRIALEDCFSNCAGIICPNLYQPVCAQQVSTGHVRTIPNGCLVNQLICETREQWIIVGNGPCLSTLDSSEGRYEGPVPASIPHAGSAHTSETQPAPTSSYEPASGYHSSLEKRLISERPHNIAPVPATGYISPSEHRLIYAPRNYGAAAPASGSRYHFTPRAPYPHNPLEHQLWSEPISYFGRGSAHAPDANPATYTHTLTESASLSNKYLIETYSARHPAHTSGSFSSSHNKAPSNHSPQPSSEPIVVHDHSTEPKASSYGTTPHSTPASSDTNKRTPSNYPQPTSSPAPALSQSLLSTPASYSHTSNQGSSSVPEADSKHTVPHSNYYAGQVHTKPSHYGVPTQKPTAATYSSLEHAKATHSPACSEGVHISAPLTDNQVPESAGVPHSALDVVPHHQPSEPNAYSDRTTVPSNAYSEPAPEVAVLNLEPNNYKEGNHSNNDGHGVDSVDDLPIDLHVLASADSYSDTTPVFSEPINSASASETVGGKVPEPVVVIFVNPGPSSGEKAVANHVPSTYAPAVDQTSHTSPSVVVPDFVSPSQASIHPIEDQSYTYLDTALDSSLQSVVNDLSQAAEPAPTQEAYSDIGAYSTPAASPTPYTEVNQYMLQVTESHSSPKQNAIAAPTHTPNSYQQRPSSGLNIYFAPAPVINVHSSPYRHPFLPIPNYNVPYAPAATSSSQRFPGSSLSLNLWPSFRAQVELLHHEISPQEISQVYNSGLPAIVGNWIDRNLSVELAPTRTNDGYSSDVPFYYQPTFTWIQYNDRKSSNLTY